MVQWVFEMEFLLSTYGVKHVNKFIGFQLQSNVLKPNMLIIRCNLNVFILNTNKQIKVNLPCKWIL